MAATGGGTWKILVEEGKTSKPTQSTIVSRTESAPVRQTVYSRASDGHASNKTINNIQRGLAFSVAITKTAVNQYFSVTGQAARRNQLNATLTYGTIAASIGLQLLKANPVGAAAIAVGGSLALANTYVNFQRNITEQNASAEYLRQQSNTSISANRGDLYNFSLF